MGPPKICKVPGKEKVKISEIFFSEDSGWRDLDEEMVLQLMETFDAGNFGQTAMSQITFLQHTDCDDKELIDNGLSACTALYRLYQKYQEKMDEAPETLKTIFTGGVDACFKQYDDDDKSTRRLWNASIHSAENLVMRKTTVFTQIQCAKDFLDKYESDAVKKMTEVLGAGQRSMIKRWMRNAKALAGSTEVKACASRIINRKIQTSKFRFYQGRNPP